MNGLVNMDGLEDFNLNGLFKNSEPFRTMYNGNGHSKLVEFTKEEMLDIIKEAENSDDCIVLDSIGMDI